LPERTPRVIVSSVVRSSHQGESHGGVYLVDFESGRSEQVMDWNDPSISWEGRGADRGLRGIAFRGDRVFLAASDEVFVYDREFRVQASFRNPYMKHTHEIFVAGHTLYVTSTGFDSILEFDLASEGFTRGVLLRYSLVDQVRRKAGLHPLPRARWFDPNAAGGPEPGDTSHLNNAVVEGDTLYVGGRILGHLVELRSDASASYARIPFGSHNARPYAGGVLMNHTDTDRIAFLDRRGVVRKSFPLPAYDPGELEFSDLPMDQARQAFGRGLAVLPDGRIAGGSSPATVTLYRFDPPELLASVNLTMDVRNAVHGLEVWPFD
jgi:hypothetical protein